MNQTSIVEYFSAHERYKCGYCKNEDTCYSFGNKDFTYLSFNLLLNCENIQHKSYLRYVDNYDTRFLIITYGYCH